MARPPFSLLDLAKAIVTVGDQAARGLRPLPFCELYSDSALFGGGGVSGGVLLVVLVLPWREGGGSNGGKMLICFDRTVPISSFSTAPGEKDGFPLPNRIGHNHGVGFVRAYVPFACDVHDGEKSSCAQQ